MDQGNVGRTLTEGVGHMAFLGLVTAAIAYRWAQTEYAKEHGRKARKSTLMAWLSDIKWQAAKADKNARLLARWLASDPAESELKKAATEAVVLWNVTRAAWAVAKAAGWKSKVATAALRKAEGNLDLFLTNNRTHGIIGDGGEVPPKTD